MLSNDEKYNIISDSAKECGLDARMSFVEKKSDLSTCAQKMMGSMSHYKNPHKNSYLHMNNVDVCFYIEHDKACITFTARWFVGAADLSTEKMGRTTTIINKMLETMQEKINAKLQSQTLNQIKDKR